MVSSSGPNSESLRKMYVDQLANEGVTEVQSSLPKVAQVNKEYLEEAGQKDASWKSEEECQGEDVYIGISP